MWCRVGQTRVAVVGAGAAGLCVGRHLVTRPQRFSPPVIFERTGRVGGTWVYEECVETHPEGQRVHSSMYRDLRTNLPKEIMMFPDFPFEPQLPSFLSHQDVLYYLESYCTHFTLMPHIRFNTVVEKVKPVTMTTGLLWEVTSYSVDKGQQTEMFDSVFICSGHYSEPHLPPLPGLSHFRGLVLHSHSYRCPEPFSGCSVVVLGAGPSGVDISFELAGVKAQVILSHGKPRLTCLLPPGVTQAPPLTRVQEDGAVEFEDGTLLRPQVLLFCTGYRFSFPFLKEGDVGLHVDQHHISPLYKHLLPPAFPSLFIIGICTAICPFLHFHCQVQFALAVLEGSVSLPTIAEMEEEVDQEAELRRREGVAQRHLHRLDSLQWDYYRSLAAAACFVAPPPVMETLYEEVKAQKRKLPQHYRWLNYRIVSDTQWEEQGQK